jgi:hydrogenase/urease accessory protein HupE
MKRLLLCFTLLALAVGNTQADEYSPAYLEFKQTSENVFEMLWKVPAVDSNKRLSLYVRLPDDIEIVKPVRRAFVGNAYIERSSIRRDGGLAGAEVIIDGLTRLPTDVLVRIERIDGTTEVQRLSPSSASFVVAGTPQTWDVVNTYLVFGVEHILEGSDHLLFVACLVLIAGTWRRILITITGFTIAHSITLTLAALELIRLPVPPIEASIALSILFLAREIAHERRDTLTWRYPIAVSGSFGLLHGFGFASALQDIGLPQTEIPAALLAFNVGVEIGQILFVASIIGIVWLAKRLLRTFHIHSVDDIRRLEKPIAYGVGGITMMWTVERVMVFWG